MKYDDKVPDIIKQHKQITICSCIPSAFEMVLKLLGKVKDNYYKLQYNCVNNLEGPNNVNEFLKKESVQIKFERFPQDFKREEYKKFSTSQKQEECAKLYKKISEEVIEKNKKVIIVLGSNGNYHNWVIFKPEQEIEKDKYYACTVIFCYPETILSPEEHLYTIIDKDELIKAIEEIQVTEILVYE